MKTLITDKVRISKSSCLNCFNILSLTSDVLQDLQLHANIVFLLFRTQTLKTVTGKSSSRHFVFCFVSIIFDTKYTNLNKRLCKISFVVLVFLKSRLVFSFFLNATLKNPYSNYFDFCLFIFIYP